MNHSFRLLPTPTDADRAELRYLHVQNGKATKAAAFEKFKTQPCWYQLFLGNTPMGQPRQLIVADSMAANKRYRDKFFYDKSPTARMWEWRSVNKTLAQKKAAEFRKMVTAKEKAP
jgi:hypothetical protein